MATTQHSPKTEGQQRGWHWRTGQPHSTLRDLDPKWHLDMLMRLISRDANFRDTERLVAAVSTVYTGGERAVQLNFLLQTAEVLVVWARDEKTYKKKSDSEGWVLVCHERNFRMAVDRACHPFNPFRNEGSGSYTSVAFETARDGVMLDPLLTWKFEEAELALKKAGDALGGEVTQYFTEHPMAEHNQLLISDMLHELPKNWRGCRHLYEMLVRIDKRNQVTLDLPTNEEQA